MVLIINVNNTFIYLLFIINLLYSITYNNIYIFCIHNIFNLILFDIILFYHYSKHIKLYTLNLLVSVIHFYQNKYLFTKLLFTSYFFIYYYNVNKNNRLLEVIKYFFYIFLFEDNLEKFFLNDHLIILYILSLFSIKLSKFYTIFMITYNLQYHFTFIFTIYLYNVIFKKHKYSMIEIIFNDFCIILFYFLKNSI